MADERGFTLLEMMVALAVFSLAALALLRLEGATVRQTGELDERMLAQLVARNLALGAVALAAVLPPTERELGLLDGLTLLFALLACVALYSGASQLLRNGAAIASWRKSRD